MAVKQAVQNLKKVLGMIRPPKMASDTPITSVYDFSFPLLDGTILRLKDYRGQVILIVNTASLCGFTKHYLDLEQLWQQYKDQGLLLLAIPSNDFGQQEPGSSQEIADFCQRNFKTSFPITTKQSVTGNHAHLLYQWLYQQWGRRACPRWNFHKFLFDRTGQIAAGWSAFVGPRDKRVQSRVDAVLLQKIA
jgi:glutathione peroxidase